MDKDLIRAAIKDLEDIAARTTSGNVAHQIAQIRCVVNALKTSIGENI